MPPWIMQEDRGAIWGSLPTSAQTALGSLFEGAVARLADATEGVPGGSFRHGTCVRRAVPPPSGREAMLPRSGAVTRSLTCFNFVF